MSQNVHSSSPIVTYLHINYYIQCDYIYFMLQPCQNLGPGNLTLSYWSKELR